MPNIKPISDLRNYSSVLEEVSVGNPVYLTKNGRGKYAVVDISEHEEFERVKAELKLIQGLTFGRIEGEDKGWLSPEDVREHFRRKANEEV
jgi:prevent-host-death family protein